MVSTVSDSHGADGASPLRRWTIGGLSAVAGVVVAGAMLAPPAAAQSRVHEGTGNSSSKPSSYYGEDDDAPLAYVKWHHRKHEHKHKHHDRYEHKPRYQKYEEPGYEDEREGENQYERKQEREQENQYERKREREREHRKWRREHEKFRHKRHHEHKRKVEHKRWIKHQDEYKQKLTQRIERELNDVRKLALHRKVEHEKATVSFIDSEQEYAKNLKHDRKLEKRLKRELEYLRGDSD